MKPIKLYESLFILYKCNRTINQLWSVVYAHQYDSGIVKEIAVNLVNMIKMESVSFLDEFNGSFFHNIENEYTPKVMDIRQITGPIIKRIKKWRDPGFQYFFRKNYYNYSRITINVVDLNKHYNSMQEITQAQEEVLKALWEIKDGAVADVVERLPHPKPAYNTVATVLKVLEKKAYLSHKVYGNTYVYYPLVTKKEYTQHLWKDKFKGLFDHSLDQLVSFFLKQKKVGLQELEELRELVEKEIKNQKK